MSRLETAPIVAWDVRLMNMASLALFVTFVFMAVGTVVAWAWNHPSLPVRSVVVQGDMQHQSGRAVRDLSVMGANGSFVSVDLGEVAQRVQTLNWVRTAQVHRDFPGRLRVVIEEHQPVAWWGGMGGEDLINSYGEVFSAQVPSQQGMDWPVLRGPQNRSTEVHQVWQRLQAVFAPLHREVRVLSVSERGDWSVELTGPVRIELGQGSIDDWMPVLRKALDNLPAVTSRYGVDLASMDLRYPDGFAVQLKGVVTTGHSTSPKP